MSAANDTAAREAPTDTRPRIVLFCEGRGDENALPVLLTRMLRERNAEHLYRVDPAAFVVGEIGNLRKNGYDRWNALLRAAVKRPNVGVVMVVLDGDVRGLEGAELCVVNEARGLARVAAEAGAGRDFSVGVVFARQEYESWLIGGIPSLRGRRLRDGRPGLVASAHLPSLSIENGLRDAKGYLSQFMTTRYRPTTDQRAFTEIVSLAEIRRRKLRSFRRLEHCMDLLVAAARQGQPVLTPPA